MSTFEGRLVVPFEALRMSDVEIVGGKNASLGEMISQLAQAGVKVPGGFATTAQAFRDFLSHNRLTERIADRLAGLNTEDVKALAQAGAPGTPRHWRGPAPRSAAGFAKPRSRRRWRPPSASPSSDSATGPRNRCRSPCDRARPRRTCRMPPSRDSRRRC